MGLTLLDQGSFKSDGSAKKINLPGDCDYFVCRNLTQLATTQSTGRGVKFEWLPELADDNAIKYGKEDSDDILNMDLVTSGGFRFRKSRPSPEAAVTGTAITAADPAVVTATAHGYAVGDRVRLYGTTGMLQISGMDFTVTAVGSANAFTLGYLDASGFAAAATALSARRLPDLAEVEPAALYITKITQASSAVVTFSVTHNYSVGDLIYFRVPDSMGMVEMDRLTGKVTAISAANNTVTVDIDSSGFSAFAFPASGASDLRFALAGPAGKRQLYDDIFLPANQRKLLDLPAFGSGQFRPYMLLAPGAQSPAGSTSDVITWQAWKAERNDDQR